MRTFIFLVLAGLAGNPQAGLGQVTFTRITTGPIVNDGGGSLGCAWGDYDNDGFLDLFVANGGIVQAENNALYNNEGNGNGWLKVRCIGTVSNRSAIGAKVRLLATIGGKSISLLGGEEMAAP